MLGRVLGTLEQVVAPDPSLFQSFEFYWKQIKNFYSAQNEKSNNQKHIDDTNLPYYLEQLLQILIKEQDEITEYYRQKLQSPDSNLVQKTAECIDFLLENRPLDLLVDLAISEKPVGCRQCVLKWMRRYLTCLENPVIAHGSVFKPVSNLVWSWGINLFFSTVHG